MKALMRPASSSQGAVVQHQLERELVRGGDVSLGQGGNEGSVGRRLRTSSAERISPECTSNAAIRQAVPWRRYSNVSRSKSPGLEEFRRIPPRTCRDRGLLVDAQDQGGVSAMVQVNGSRVLC